MDDHRDRAHPGGVLGNPVDRPGRLSGDECDLSGQVLVEDRGPVDRDEWRLALTVQRRRLRH